MVRKVNGLNREQVMKILEADKSKNSLEKAAILQKNFPDEGLGANDFDVHNKTAVLSESQKIKSNENHDSNAQTVLQLNDAVFDAILSDGRAFGDLFKPSVANVLNKTVPGYVPPNRFKIARELSKRYKEYRKSLIKRFESVSNISFTTYMWKNRKRVNHIAIIAHVLNKNFESLSFNVGFREFKGRHSAVRIKSFLINEKKKLKINNDALVATSTENGFNIKRAVQKDFGIWISCFCHNLKLTVQKVLKTKKNDDDDNEDEDEVDNIITSDEDEKELEGDDDIDINDLNYDLTSEESSESETGKKFIHKLIFYLFIRVIFYLRK